MSASPEVEANNENKVNGKSTSGSFQVPRIVFVVTTIVLLVALIVATVLLLTHEEHGKQSPVDPQSDENVYRFASVASSTRLCSQVGTEILGRQGGSAVDATIASLVCVGVVRFHSSGIGGDSFWTIYDRNTSTAYSINGRSQAPLGINSTMFVNNTQAVVEGGLSVAVPGEVMAFWEAHQKFGRLPWENLFLPSIKLAEEGFPIEASTASAIKSKADDGTIDRFPNLRQLVWNPQTKTWYKEGEIVRNPALANTLRKIAKGGADYFYTGPLAVDMVRELTEAGGVITEQDFAAYRAHFVKPLQLNLYGNLTVYVPPLPSGGPVMLYILNILSGYNFRPEDLSTNEKTVLTYHRHLEAFKHAYAIRSKLGDSEGETLEFSDEMEQIVQNITSTEQGEMIRSLISDLKTFPWQNYNPSFQVQEDHGTSQLSVLAPNGDAVSVTSTINLFFGSKVVGSTTGILYNNMVDDFSFPGVTNAFGVKPSPANFVKPRKRPLSSMSPAIVVDSTGMVNLVVGAAGGTRITTTTAFLTSLTMWLDKRMKAAMDAPRIHHQLLPDNAVLSRNSPQWLVDGLIQKGHVIKYLDSVSTPTGILQKSLGKIYSEAPTFKVDGY